MKYTRVIINFKIEIVTAPVGWVSIYTMFLTPPPTIPYLYHHFSCSYPANTESLKWYLINFVKGFGRFNNSR